MSIVTWSDYEHEGDSYHITVRFSNSEREAYTASWRRERDGKTGELGFELGQADHAIAEAERLIRLQRQREINAR